MQSNVKKKGEKVETAESHPLNPEISISTAGILTRPDILVNLLSSLWHFSLFLLFGLLLLILLFHSCAVGARKAASTQRQHDTGLGRKRVQVKKAIVKWSMDQWILPVSTQLISAN